MLTFCFTGKPDNHTESQETSHVSDTNNVQSRKPTSRNAVRDNTSSVTGPSVTTCAWQAILPHIYRQGGWGRSLSSKLCFSSISMRRSSMLTSLNQYQKMSLLSRNSSVKAFDSWSRSKKFNQKNRRGWGVQRTLPLPV